MKKILLFISCLILSMPSIAQDSKLEQIIEVQSPQSTLFINAQQWATSDIAGVTKQLETSDKETGTILVNISALYTPYCLDYTFKFNIKIDCRDNKYRATISNPVVYISLNSHYSNFNALHTTTLTMLRDKLGAVKDLSTYTFNGIKAWNIEEIQPVLLEKGSKITNLKAEKAGLDPKKDKKKINSIDYDLKHLESQVSILSEISKAWDKCTQDIFASIEKAMIQKDDF